ERAAADVDGIAVAAALADVRDEVLRRGNDPRRLEGTNEGRSHARREQRIFTVRLFDASPANVVRDVDHRRQDLPDAAAPRFARDGASPLSDGRGVPRGRERVGLRKDRRALAHQTVDGFVEGNDWEAEPRPFDKVFLNRVDALGMRARSFTATRLCRDLQPE